MSSIATLMSANRTGTVLRSSSDSADVWSAVVCPIDSGFSVLATDRPGDTAPGDDLRGAAHSTKSARQTNSQIRIFAQRSLNTAVHCRPNFSPSEFRPRTSRTAFAPLSQA
jgi:hypothetical protein